jgi:precorrin-3B methylase
MASEAELEARRERAARMVLEGGIATPALGDDSAEALLDWALSQVGRCAFATAEMADGQADAYVSAGVAKILRLMGMVNELVEEHYEMGRVEVVQKLTRLMSAALE